MTVSDRTMRSFGESVSLVSGTSRATKILAKSGKRRDVRCGQEGWQVDTAVHLGICMGDKCSIRGSSNSECYQVSRILSPRADRRAETRLRFHFRRKEVRPS